ncbi:kelch-like protein 29 [Haliotis rufescens]|uniref:kelch-like protein 29 n=1 Tax=Haliotis rufescens TaxID=6454 RepID=UPI00201EFFD1|nr:kelch-like protein 29 [Haliotis rufescens]
MSFALDLSSAVLRARADGKFCDVNIVVKGQDHRCHRLVLCSASSFFKTALGDTENSTGKMMIRGIDLSIFTILLDYIYGEDIVLTRDNAADILFASLKLGMERLQRECERYLGDHMTSDTSIEVWRTARMKQLTDLQTIAFEWIVAHFDNVVSTESFIALKADELSVILREDKLKVPSEEFVFEAVMKWMRHHPSSRKSNLSTVLASVRLPFINPHYLLHYFTSNDVLIRNKSCHRLVENAKAYQLLPGRRAEFSSSTTVPRASAGVEDIIIVIGGYIEQHRQHDGSSATSATVSSLTTPQTPVTQHRRVQHQGNIQTTPKHTREFIRANVVLHQSYTTSRTVHGYSFLSNHWYKLASLPQDPGFDFATSAHGSSIFVSGGTLTSKRLQRFDKNRWISENSLPEQRCSHSSAVVGDHLYLVGGLWFDGRGVFGGMVSSISKFSVSSDAWESCSGTLQVPVQKPAVAVIHDKIYLFGGVDQYGNHVKTTQYYDTSKDGSCVLHSIPSPATEIRALAVDDVVYLVSRYGLQQFTEDKLICKASLSELDGCVDFEVCQHRGQVYVMGGFHESTLRGSRVIISKNFDVKTQAHFLGFHRAGFGCVKVTLGKKYLKGHRQ